MTLPVPGHCFSDVPTPTDGEKAQKSCFTTQKTEEGTYTVTLPRSVLQQDREAPSIAEARVGDRLFKLSED